MSNIDYEILPKPTPLWVLIIFSLAFSIPGIGLLVHQVGDNRTLESQKRWVETSGTVDSMPTDPNENDAWEDYPWSKIRYSWIWNGGSASKNAAEPKFGEVWEGETSPDRALLSKLWEGFQNDQPITVWVNPKDSSEAVIHRYQIRAVDLVLSLFTLSHGALGIILGYYIFTERSRIRRMRQRLDASERPDMITSLRADWSEARSEPLPNMTTVIWVIVLCFIIPGGVWTGVLILESEGSETWLKLLALLPIAVAVLAVWMSCRSHSHRKYIKNLEVSFSPPLPTAGEELTLTVIPKSGGISRQKFQRSWTLECEQGSKKEEENSSPEILWSHEEPPRPDGTSGAVFIFQLPDDAKATWLADRTITWRFYPTQGAKLSGVFELPIFEKSIDT